MNPMSSSSLMPSGSVFRRTAWWHHSSKSSSFPVYRSCTPVTSA